MSPSFGWDPGIRKLAKESTNGFKRAINRGYNWRSERASDDEIPRSRKAPMCREHACSRVLFKDLSYQKLGTLDISDIFGNVRVSA